jgi:predicted nicotinamide N-methyase
MPLSKPLSRYETEPIELTIGKCSLTLLRVKDLENWIDREALLRDETEEPPYWALLWSGAGTLARYIEEHIDCTYQTVLDLGCGLGLIGIIASGKGAQVTFADKEPEAVSFANANAQLNDCCRYTAKQLDFTQDRLDQRFSLILGAEILYNRPVFPALIDFLIQHLTPSGKAIIADAHRTNTDEFYQQLDACNLSWTRTVVQEREDNLPLTVHIVTIQHPKHNAE